MNDRLRILMTADCIGGVWNYALELSRELARQGCSVALAVMGGPLSYQRRHQALAIPNLTVLESGYKLEWMEDPWRDVQESGKWLLQLEKEYQADIVHLNGYAHGALPWRAPALIVGHSCVLSWWEAVHGQPAPQAWEAYRLQVERGLNSVDTVVAPTDAMLRSLHQHYRFGLRGEVVPNGRDPDLFQPGEKAPYIFCMGRLWDEAKNIAVLERVAPGVDWPIYVAGDAQRPGGSRSGPAADWKGLRLLGPLGGAELARWLSNASIFVSPARYEPFGLSILEAGLAGCALLLGDLASLRENWDGAAWFARGDDAAAVQRNLRLLIENARCREKAARNCRARALEFSPERMAQGYLAAYEKLMAGREALPAGIRLDSPL